MSGRLPPHLASLRPYLQDIAPVVIEGEPRFVLFFSFTDGKSRAIVQTAVGATVEEAWRLGIKQVVECGVAVHWLRIDWVDAVERKTWKALRTEFGKIKRNYFRLGISLDPAFAHAFLETELNANAMLYGGPKEVHAVLNEKNFAIYAGRRHGLKSIDFADESPVWLFTTKGAFVGDDGATVHRLNGSGLDTGRRSIDRLGPDDVLGLIDSGSRYLASQVLENGRFHYGWHPCFDRPINSYNSLRHASSLYAMLEAWEITRDDGLKAAIDRALSYLTTELIRTMPLPEGGEATFLVDPGAEIKLGGNAVSILALVKYTELTGDRRHLDLLEGLATGIVYMQNPGTGRFRHVLNYPALDLKQAFRIIYYEGEAAFGLMRLYGLTGDPRWLAAVEKAFGHFIRQQHWKSHDHWLSYCVNELTMHRPEERYYRFGLDNFKDYLGFVLQRITTFPTLLELMMAAEKMVARLRADPTLHHLLAGVDLRRFYKALHFRAHYLLNGHFWPELAMFYANPAKIAGSFFIRHHAFRVRIDDVEHYLSGFVAYRKYLLARKADPDSDYEGPAMVEPARHWTAPDVERATGGRWATPMSPDWSASGLCIFAPTMRQGDMVAMRLAEGEKGVPARRIPSLPHRPQAVIASRASKLVPADVPTLRVDDVGASILALGRYARDRMAGRLIGVTGSAGKTTVVAMLAHVLEAFGEVGQTRENANLPHGIAWNLASIPWDAPHIVLELAIGSMARNAALTRPHVAVFTNILPAHLEYHRDLATVAERKSAIFGGMEPGSAVVLNRDMAEWDRVRAAALARRLKVIRYGRSPDCDFQLLHYDAATHEVTARAGTREMRYRIGAAGEHMALNSLAALATLSALGHELDVAIERLRDFAPLPGRGEELQVVLDGQRLTVLDEAYNANPGSMEAALVQLGARQCTGRRIAVLGEMLELGDGAEDYHARLAPLIARHGIDRVHALGDLYGGFWDALPEDCRGVRPASLDALKPILRAELRDGDVLLLKGSHSTKVHELVDWLKAGTDPLGQHVGALLYDVDADRVIHAQGEGVSYPPASLTKLLTLCLIEERLHELGESREKVITVSAQAAEVNSRWGFAAGDRAPIGDLMRAAMTVSANEAANALAEWHSGSQAAFTQVLNRRAVELGLTNTRFGSPSGLGRGQRITVSDALALARHVQARHPQVAALAATREFTWKGKTQSNTNSLLTQIEGADGFKTGRLNDCFNLILSVAQPGRRRLAIVLGTQSKAERDEAVRSLLEYG